MTYVKDWSGLYPSVYGGGGSPSSKPLPDASPVLSRESAALVSKTTGDCAGDGDWNAEVSSNGGAGAKAGKNGEPDSVTDAWMRSSSSSSSGLE